MSPYVVAMSGFLSKAADTVSNKKSSMRQPEIGSPKEVIARLTQLSIFLMMTLNQSHDESISACHIMSMSLLHFDIHDTAFQNSL